MFTHIREAYAVLSRKETLMNWREVFASDELPKLLDEGIADEKEGKAYWEQMRDEFCKNDMPASSDKAGEFAQQEQGHHDLLKDVKHTVSGWRSLL